MICKQRRGNSPSSAEDHLLQCYGSLLRRWRCSFPLFENLCLSVFWRDYVVPGVSENLPMIILIFDFSWKFHYHGVFFSNLNTLLPMSSTISFLSIASKIRFSYGTVNLSCRSSLTPILQVSHNALNFCTFILQMIVLWIRWVFL